MKRILLSTAVLIALASPAIAGGPQKPPAQPGGEVQAQHQTANANARSASRSSSGATSRSTSQGGSSNVSVNNTVGGGGGGSSGGGGRAPDVFLPSIGGGGMDCPTVGFGAAGSGLSGGGGFGPSWISSKCDARKTVDLLSNVFGPAVAREYAIQNIAGVKEALAAATQGRPAQYQHPAWCVTNKGRWLRNLPECGEDPR